MYTMNAQIVMKQIITIIATILLLASCGGEQTVEEKKEELSKLKDKAEGLYEKIKRLEQEIGEVVDSSTWVIVSTLTTEDTVFAHYTAFRGNIKSLRNIRVNSEVVGKVISLKVKEGMVVRKNGLVAVIDPERTVKQIDEVKTSLELADELFKKQKALWKQEIGTEVQYLQAKNNKESLEKRLSTLKTELDKHYIRAPFSGTIENVNIREGEMVQPGSYLFNLIDHKDLYAEADISESFVQKIKKRQPVELMIPTLNQTFQSQITAVGQIINPTNRTFTIEIKLDDKREFKPNLTTIIRIKDYENVRAIVVPVKAIQHDALGSYLFTAVKEGKYMVAKQRYVKTGISYHNHIEVLEGLKPGEMVISSGFRNLQDDDKIIIMNK